MNIQDFLKERLQNGTNTGSIQKEVLAYRDRTGRTAAALTIFDYDQINVFSVDDFVGLENKLPKDGGYAVYFFKHRSSIPSLYDLSKAVNCAQSEYFPHAKDMTRNKLHWVGRLLEGDLQKSVVIREMRLAMKMEEATLKANDVIQEVTHSVLFLNEVQAEINGVLNRMYDRK